MKRSLLDTRTSAVVLLSGGLDSAVALAETAKTHRTFALLVDYGQRNGDVELVAARKLAGHFGVVAVGVRVEFPSGARALAQRGGDGVSPHYVPGRNAVLVSLALSSAESLHAERVVIGVTAEDRHGFPDCRPGYFAAWRSLASVGMARSPEIVTPLASLSKGDVVRRAVALSVPLDLTWSCYAAGPAPCRTCGACVVRARGFADAGVVDPLES